MTDEQITNRCQHCGDTKRAHGVRKPYACRGTVLATSWEPWTLEAYQEAQGAGRLAAAARVLTPQEEADRAAAIAAAPVLLGRTIDLTPNWGRLFEQFARDARQAGGTLSASLCAAQFDEYPEAPEAVARRAAVLRAVQGYLAPLTIALQAATTAQAIEELRDVAADTLATLDRWAGEFEAAADVETN